ncbi:unnamed protein product [Hapterophycus canaliculatus]
MREKGSLGSRAWPKNLCLTMHQPWASLLVAGVKRVEGRSWSTEHRGVLWIHAAAKEPSEAEVRAVEDQYRSIYSAESIPGDLSLPRSYPTSCLLGCVELVDCLPQAKFQAARKIPFGPKLESQSDFVFICQAPRNLVLPFSLPGQPKIWTLDKTTREAAEAGLGPVVQGPSPVDFQSC